MQHNWYMQTELIDYNHCLDYNMKIIFVQFVRIGLFQLILRSKKTKESKTGQYIKEKREKVCLKS